MGRPFTPPSAVLPVPRVPGSRAEAKEMNACPCCSAPLGVLGRRSRRCRACGCLLRSLRGELAPAAAKALDGMIRRSPYQHEAVELVLSALQAASGKRPGAGGGAGQDVGAEALYATVRDTALFRHSAAAAETVRGWGIASPKDLAEVVRMLVAAGLVQLAGGESPDDLAGACRIGDESWQRPDRWRGQCRTCGYDLRASKDRCPECGTPFVKGES